MSPLKTSEAWKREREVGRKTKFKYQIWDGKVFWLLVRTQPDTKVAMGSCSTLNQAIRNARNFIKHNQNEVYK